MGCSRAEQHRRPAASEGDPLCCGGTVDGTGTTHDPLRAIDGVGASAGNEVASAGYCSLPRVLICDHVTLPGLGYRANLSSSASRPASFSSVLVPNPMAVISS